MSTAEETINNKAREISGTKTAPLANRILDFLSSVRLGIILLCILVFLSILGMVIIQQNVPGFDAYYATRTPAERLVFSYLGLFDIYYSWYYNVLLLFLSMNLVLASIDRFPSAWKYITEPKLWATRDWLLKQRQNASLRVRADNENEVSEQIGRIFRENGFDVKTTERSNTVYATDENNQKDFSRTVTQKYFYVFGERGKWNRLGAYIVHVALLVLFLGHFVAHQTGFEADVRLTPDTDPAIQRDFNALQQSDTIQLIKFNLDRQERYNVTLPFTITCTDIEQKLIDPKGAIDSLNTMDWRTQIRIDDPVYGTTVADVSLNNPFSYRGYRFFQAQTIPVGHARALKLELTPENGGEKLSVDLMRNGSTVLPDGTRIEYKGFYADFFLNGGAPATRSADYNNPVLLLNVTPPAGETERVFAFANKLPDDAPINAPKAGYRWRLADFEKAPLAHVLSIKYDPFNAAMIAWYFGGIGLILALIFVFFFSHKRVWALVERKSDGEYEVIMAGEANRNHFGFEDRFNQIVGALVSRMNFRRNN